MLSLGIEAARALLTARRRRGFMSGSGMPDFAATVISRLSLENAAERFLSCAPLRCMMFLNLEWPAMGARLSRSAEKWQLLNRGAQARHPLATARSGRSLVEHGGKIAVVRDTARAQRPALAGIVDLYP